jgi:hypothetical protein
VIVQRVCLHWILVNKDLSFGRSGKRVVLQRAAAENTEFGDDPFERTEFSALTRPMQARGPAWDLPLSQEPGNPLGHDSFPSAVARSKGCIYPQIWQQTCTLTDVAVHRHPEEALPKLKVARSSCGPPANAIRDGPRGAAVRAILCLPSAARITDVILAALGLVAAILLCRSFLSWLNSPVDPAALTAIGMIFAFYCFVRLVSETCDLNTGKIKWQTQYGDLPEAGPSHAARECLSEEGLCGHDGRTDFVCRK